MSELLNCPFCGGEAKFVESRDSVIPGKLEVVAWKVQCSKCGASTLPNNYYGDKKEAANSWNTRSERTCTNSYKGGCTVAFKCSSCGYSVFYPKKGSGKYVKPKYCHNCGAKVVE